MHNCDQNTFQLLYFQDQKLLMLCWHTFAEDSSDVMDSIFVYKGSQYCEYK